jgi:hypothetical protein
MIKAIITRRVENYLKKYCVNYFLLILYRNIAILN